VTVFVTDQMPFRCLTNLPLQTRSQLFASDKATTKQADTIRDIKRQYQMQLPYYGK